MNGDYGKYLLMMVIVACGAAAISAFFMIRKKRSGPRNGTIGKKKNKPVDCGNISVFSDRQGNIAIIPYVADLFGSGRATSGIVLLKSPYRPEKLGAALRSSLISCRNAGPIGSAELLKLLQVRDWKEFSEGKRNLSVYYKEGIGVVFNTTVQTSEGAFVFVKKGMEYSLPPDAEDEAMGNLSLDLLKRCR